MKKLVIGIATYEEMKARTLAIANGNYMPKEGEPKLWFTSIENIFSEHGRQSLEDYLEPLPFPWEVPWWEGELPEHDAPAVGPSFDFDAFLDHYGDALTWLAGKAGLETQTIAETLLPTIFNIFDKWQITEKQQMVLLGRTGAKTLPAWRENPEKAKLSENLVTRTSHILGIYKSLQIMLPDQVQADAWVNAPNASPFFNGHAPLERLLEGGIDDLLQVNYFLTAERV